LFQNCPGLLPKLGINQGLCWSNQDKNTRKKDANQAQRHASYSRAVLDYPSLHLHRHTFEITQVGDKPLARLMKDVISVNRRSTAAVDFVADNPGLTLFYCHKQLHMDFGFMQPLEYAR